ncbi:MAG: alginate export family protein [Flavobacteriaceae bacterium]
MKTRLISTVIIAILFATTMVAQSFDLSAESRSRFENKNGYKTLIAPGIDGSNFISQRTRLNFGYKNTKLKMKISMQNVRVWGDVSTLSSNDNNSSLHEAWGEAILSDKISLKLGRQEIVYDDSRIFGNVGWAQQARSHDAFLFKFKPDVNNRIDVGVALNSDSQAGTDLLYSNVAGYKTFQYAWYHGSFENYKLSFLGLNTGIEFLNTSAEQEVDYMQTVGPRVTYKNGKLTANVATYFQMGEVATTKVNALYYAGNVGFKVAEDLNLGLGYEYLSGKSQDPSSTNADIESFAPLFGTNHKFNGWMDYFYVGNHGGSVGLKDINAIISYKKDKFSVKLIPHLFSAAADVYNGTTKMDAKLGTEIDLTLGYKIAKDITLNAGYSKMLATDTMEQLKGGDKDENNSWAWLMFTFKPNLFSHNAK